MDTGKKNRLDRMFAPRGLAVFGGVTKPGAFANMILTSLIAYGYPGALYPISPAGGTVMGLRVRRSLDEVDGPVDLASISVPAEAVPAVLEECLKHGVAGAEIHTSGFAETGEPRGIELQRRIKAISGQGLPVVGPNCFGLHSPAGGITLLPGFDFSREPGSIALISQSGGIANDFGHEAIAAGLKISKVISYGNGCDLEATELLEYLAADKDTRFIAAYLEGVRDGRRFLETVRAVSARKPVVIWKGGLTPLGARATLSHTGSLGGEAQIWQGALAQAGAIQVMGLDEMVDTLVALSYFNRRGRRIALAGGGGAIGVFSSDLAHRWGLDIPAFSDETRRRLAAYFPTPGNSVVNPLDTGTPAFPLEGLSGMIREIMTREPVDILVMIMLLHPLEVVPAAFMKTAGLTVDASPAEPYLTGLLNVLTEIRKTTDKDIAVVLENKTYRLEDVNVELIRRRVADQYQRQGLAVFPSAERALRGIRNAAGLRQ
jgi:acyl-CoA synthetase (NDP forming)